MSMFNVRVELLHHADGNDYERLHARMRAQGFATAIVAANGSRYHLPPAEYVHVSAEATQQVRDRATRVAQAGLRAGLQCRVYVLQFVDWASYALEVA
jgi:hypothetical protein